MADIGKDDLYEMRRRPVDGEHSQKSNIDENVGWAIEPGNEKDEVDMRRMGHKQQLSVRTLTDYRYSRELMELSPPEKLSFVIHPRPDNYRDQHLVGMAFVVDVRALRWRPRRGPLLVHR